MRLSGLFLFERIRKWRMERKMTGGTEYGNFLQNKRKFERIGQFIGQSKMPGGVEFTGVWDMESVAQMHQVMWIYWSTVD